MLKRDKVCVLFNIQDKSFAPQPSKITRMPFKALIPSGAWEALKTFDALNEELGKDYGDISVLDKEIWGTKEQDFQCRPVNDAHCRQVQASMREVGSYMDSLSIFIVYETKVLVDGKLVSVFYIVDGRHRIISLMRLINE